MGRAPVSRLGSLDRARRVVRSRHPSVGASRSFRGDGRAASPHDHDPLLPVVRDVNVTPAVAESEPKLDRPRRIRVRWRNVALYLLPFTAAAVGWWVALPTGFLLPGVAAAVLLAGWITATRQR